MKPMKILLSILLCVCIFVMSVGTGTAGLTALFVKADAATIVDSGTCGADGDNVTWTLDSNGTLTISGEGEMKSYGYSNNAPWKNLNVFNVVIENGVTSIGDRAFEDCYSLMNITIPDSVTNIGWNAFKGCSSLTSITIPDSVTEIGSGAFSGCTGLTSITLPDGVTSIGNSVFSGCSSLTSITIPDGVTSIDFGAFSDCSSLTSITISDNVTSIGEHAFYGCTGLTSITIPAGVTFIGDWAFSDCTGLTSITIPDSVTSIGNSVFSRCSSLTSITISDNVTSIGEYAFSSCTGLTSITIPSKVTSIGAYAFGDVANVEYSGSADGSPWGARTINGYIEDGLVYRDSKKTELTACPSSRTGDVIIPDSVTRIGNSAFIHCIVFTEISIPDSVTEIGNDAFSDCIGLTSITLPDGVTKIGDWAFAFCRNLTEITIPDSVTSIGEYAFVACVGLTKIKIPDSVISIGSYAFEHVANVEYSGSADGSPWGARTVNGYIEDGLVYRNSEKTELTACPSSRIGEVIIHIGVTNIGRDAFYKCTGLTNITIPDSVTSIGRGAFSDCSSLTNITIPDSVANIGNWAFSDCSSLADIYFNNPLCEIYDNEWTIDENAVIHGYVGSTVQKYAEKYGRTFVPIDHQHSFEYKVTKEADCTHNGVKTFTCTDENCGYSYTEEIPAKGHVEGESVTENVVNATCTDAGSYDSVIRCSVCNEELSREKKNVNALGHDEIEHEAKAATCTEKGNNAYVTCSRCDYTTFEETPALGHKEEKISAVAPTCTKTGLSEGKRCSRCGIVLVAQKEIGKVTHTWDAGKVTKPAAVGVKGVKTFTCTVCKTTRTEDIPALPAEKKVKRGDVNLNGEISVSDARFALRAAVGLDTLSGDAFRAADVDSNGEISVSDARMILRVAVGLDKFDD